MLYPQNPPPQDLGFGIGALYLNPESFQLCLGGKNLSFDSKVTQGWTTGSSLTLAVFVKETCRES